MRIIIAGSRHIQDYSLIEKAIKESGFEITEIVSGMALGPDSAGLLYGDRNGIPVKEFPAKWDDLNAEVCFVKSNKFGKKYNSLAGHNRNLEMAKYANALILVWDGVSKGSANMLKLARENNLEIFEKIV